jgi:hypothetical protein
MRRFRAHCTFLFVAACLYAPRLAHAQEPSPQSSSQSDPIAAALETLPPELRDSLRQALAGLTDDEWQARESAENSLEDSAVPDSAIEALLDSGALSPEQEHRLIGVLRDRILGRERGAMGITMTTSGTPVQVVEVRPNMPARGRLQIGDTIIAIDGIAILTSLDLEDVLGERRPGQEIEVTVRRRQRDANGVELPGEETTITVPITLTDDSQFSEEEQNERRLKRIARAREVVLRHAPRPTPPRRMGGDPPGGNSEAIEIETLRRQIALYQSTNDQATRMMLEEEWRAMKDALLIATLASGISEAERQRRWDLYNAYVELLPPADD